jgi:propionyl-CoA synthetase
MNRAGSSNRAVPGYHVQVVDEEGRLLGPNETGSIVISLPLPPGCAQTLWNDHPRYLQAYLRAFPGYYHTGDGGCGRGWFVYIMGRTDDVINVPATACPPARWRNCWRCRGGGRVRGDRRAGRAQGPCAAGPGGAQDARIAEEALQRELVALVASASGARPASSAWWWSSACPRPAPGRSCARCCARSPTAKPIAASTIDDPAILAEIAARLAASAGQGLLRPSAGGGWRSPGAAWRPFLRLKEIAGRPAVWRYAAILDGKWLALAVPSPCRTTASSVKRKSKRYWR